MLLKSSLFILVVLSAKCLCQSRIGYFTVIAPGTVRSNSTYNIAVSLSDFNQTSWLSISLLGNNLSVQHRVEVEPRTTKLVSLKVPEVNALDGQLKVGLSGGIIWEKTVSVQITNLRYQVYIQTDKPIYKPGDVVRFRVICIDELTRPALVNDSLDVLIYNSDNDVIKKIPNIKLIQGVFKGELHLSEYTKFGKWNLEVRGPSTKRSEFTVSRYTLPKFKAEIIAMSDVSLTDGKVDLVVKASYAHDEPIKGIFSMKLNPPMSGGILNGSKLIDGQARISLDFERDLGINRTQLQFRSGKLSTVDVEVQVEDFLTREVFEATKQIQIHSHPYRVTVTAPQAFEPNTLVEVKVLVTNLQNERIQDSINPVRINVESIEEQGAGDEVRIPFDVFLENGFGVAHLNLSNANITEYILFAEYRGYTSLLETLRRLPENNFYLNVLTQSPEVGKEFIIELRSKTPIDHFIYELTSRGNILLTQRVQVEANATTYQLRLNATFIMVPKVTIFVHRIKDRKFDSSLKDVYVKRTFQNSIQITAEKEVKPGASVSINVTTDEGSYVGLMAVDERLLLRSEDHEDLTEDNVFTRQNDYNSLYGDALKYPGYAAGLITLMNRELPGYFSPSIESRFELGEENITKVDLGPEVHLPRLRELFKDSWLFEDFERTPKDGLQLHKTCPDTITSWVITGFSLNPVTGISLTRNKTKLDVFQTFYVSMDLPGVVKEGETIEIPVYVFNFLGQDAQTDVKFESKSEHLHVLDSVYEKPTFGLMKTLLLPKGGRMKLTFMVRPKKSGQFNVTVSAISPLASDAVQKTLFVESEGIPHLMSKTFLVPFLQDGNVDDTIHVNISKKAVRGSERIELSVVGDIFGPLTESLKSLAQVPYGTGMETNTHFVSNMLVLKYLKTFNHSNPSLETKCLRFLEKGYQSLLQFKRLDGSFSAVNATWERTGDTMHTAAVLWGLQQARSFIEIDKSVINRGLLHLSKQTKTGSLTTGNGLEDDATLTSLVLLAFLADDAPTDKHKEMIANGTRYLHEIQDKLESPAAAALSAYILILAKYEKSGELLSKLHSQAASTSAIVREYIWARSDSIQANLEITAGSFFYLLRSLPRRTETLFPIVNNLLASKLSVRIPTHLLALDAMIGIAKSMDFGSKSLSLHFKTDEEETANLSVNLSNVHVTQSIQFKGTTRNVSLHCSGKGFAVVSIKSRYNLLQAHAPVSSTYRTNLTVLDEKSVTLRVCVAVQSREGTSNFTVMEVNLPSGFVVLGKSLDSQFNEQIKSIQVNAKENSVVTTIKDLTQAGTCVEMQALRAFNVLNAKPMSTVVYDLYNEDRRTTTLHELELSNNSENWDSVWT